MVQGIGKGKPQVTMSQQSLFGNGQAGPLSNQPRNFKEEEERARAKFKQTDAGRKAAQNAVAKTEEHARGDAQPRSAQKPKGPPAPQPAPCHLTHPPYPVADGYVVYGGSGIVPHIKDCDVYCGLDQSAQSSMPWDLGALRFVYHIRNYGTPTDAVSFKRMIAWLALQVKAGKKLHVGCYAGHGRTGMVLAALRFEMTGDKDAIMHVRNNYCDQSVETDGQVKWLVDNFGMNTAPPRKKKYASSTTASAAGAYRAGADWKKDFDDDFESTASQEPREAKHNSWAANSPWQIFLEGPPADLAENTTWYDDAK